jgi:hypothetical protein
MWKTLLQAAQELQGPDGSAFSWAQIMQKAQSLDPSHNRIAFGSTFQSMVIQSPVESTSPVGKVFNRVSRGQYLVTGVVAGDAASEPKLLDESVTRALTMAPNQVEAQRRSRELAAGFDFYVAHFAANVPFERANQLAPHRKTIEMRREFNSMARALSDAEFLESLYVTIQTWGVGQRGFALVSRKEFALMLDSHLPMLSVLDGQSIEDASIDVSNVGQGIASLINQLGVVSNISKIVAGSVTLHHLLPDLVPPLDREWSGRFFKWSPRDVQSSETGIFVDAFALLARVAAEVRPSRLLNDQWNTSSSMILDNAVVGYCQMELVVGVNELQAETALDTESVPSFLRLEVETSELVASAALSPTSFETSAPDTSPRRKWYRFWKS